MIVQSAHSYMFCLRSAKSISPAWVSCLENLELLLMNWRTQEFSLSLHLSIYGQWIIMTIHNRFCTGDSVWGVPLGRQISSHIEISCLCQEVEPKTTTKIGPSVWLNMNSRLLDVQVALFIAVCRLLYTLSVSLDLLYWYIRKTDWFQPWSLCNFLISIIMITQPRLHVTELLPVMLPWVDWALKQVCHQWNYLDTINHCIISNNMHPP